jgi:GNAT superfamily N-acetyltransferase
MEGVSTGEFNVSAASVDDAEAIAALISSLLVELYPDMAGMYRVEALVPVARDLLGSANVFGLAARNSAGATVGVLMLSQCEAIYALGRFGEISELYVDPQYRSSGLGAVLLGAAKALALSKGWSMLEVGAPDVPRWQKTVDFYLKNGFFNVGPRLYLPLT